MMVLTQAYYIRCLGAGRCVEINGKAVSALQAVQQSNQSLGSHDDQRLRCDHGLLKAVPGWWFIRCYRGFIGVYKVYKVKTLWLRHYGELVINIL